MNEARLTRSESDKMLAGVCGGLATYIGVDSVLVRAAFVVLLFASGIGFPIYMILWFIMPSEETADRPNAEIIQENIEEMGKTVSSSVGRVGHPGTVGFLLVLLGLYFLLNEMGLLGWLSSGVFWPIVMIAFGIFLLVQRSQQS